jgi:cyclic lactone autoinducer peptide
MNTFLSLSAVFLVQTKSILLHSPEIPEELLK